MDCIPRLKCGDTDTAVLHIIKPWLKLCLLTNLSKPWNEFGFFCYFKPLDELLKGSTYPPYNKKPRDKLGNKHITSKEMDKKIKMSVRQC